MTKSRIYMLEVLGLLLVASVAVNGYQYVSEHRLGYVSHILVHATHVPDSIYWNGQSYFTDGSANPALTKLTWLGLGKAGSRQIDVFKLDGISSQKEIGYIMGGLLNVADVSS